MSRPEGTGWADQRTQPSKVERKLAARQAAYTPSPGTRMPGSLNRKKRS